jgi:ribosomal protein L11 methylase PrmA
MRRVAPLNPAKAGRRILSHPADRRAQEPLMLDIIMLALGLSFFVVGIGYAYACERL